jgi:alpha-amylase
VEATVSLSLVIHNHQPVGNFGWVIEDVYEHAYSPLLGALDRHPGVRLALHYTGPLLQWLAASRPGALDQIRALVDRGQIEIVGGAYYEPILATLPDRDRHGQLVRMADELERLFGRRPQGAWLAERVWEPSLSYDLALAGYRWTILDDSHLRAASIKEDAMWTAFTTDDRGQRLTVFGTEQGLRYRIPFKPVDDVMAYLADRRTPDGRFVGVMGDDGEKLGSWPGTYAYCWSDERWVERFFEAIEANVGWLTMVTPSTWLQSHPPTVRAYFPTASYVEMTEWVLPPDENPIFSGLLESARQKGLPEARYLRGGFWRNYAARYREINELHKQMLRASERVDRMAEGPTKARALDHLYRGQSNDCYWHGLFGGIYINHMRMATLAHLIAAEDLADVAAADLQPGGPGPFGARFVDTDLDAVDEILVAMPGQTIIVDPAHGAGVSSWDLRASRMALSSVLRRRPEAYHHALIAHELEARDAAADGTPDESDAPKTIHERITVTEPGLASRLHYDRHERRSGLTHLLPAGGKTSLDQMVAASYEELGDFVEEPFEVISVAANRVSARRAGVVLQASGPRELVVEKEFTIAGGRSDPGLILATTVMNPTSVELAFELAVEWNVNMLGGGHNPDAWYETEPGEVAGRVPHDSSGELPLVARLCFGNDYEGVRIEASLDPPTGVGWYPVETVSNSDIGFERVYQGSSILFRWPVTLAPGQRLTFTVGFEVAQSRDHAAEEAGLDPLSSSDAPDATGQVRGPGLSR